MRTALVEFDEFPWSLLATALLAAAIYLRLRPRRSHQSKLPGPPGLPLIGNALQLLGTHHDVFETFRKHNEEYGDVVDLKVAHRHLVFLTNPDDVELILSSQEHLDKSPEYSFFKPWLGNGLLISTGSLWRSHRKVIAPTFHLNILKSFFPQFNRNSRATVERLGKVTGEMDCHDYMAEATVEMLLETVMGVRKETQGNTWQYAMDVMKMCDILHLRQTKFYLNPEPTFSLTSHKKDQDELLGRIHSFNRKVLHVRKEEFAKNGSSFVGHTKDVEGEAHLQDGGLSFGMSKGVMDDIDQDIGEKKRLAFLDKLLESSGKGAVLTEADVQNQITTIMFEGHDTTAAASSFFLCIMAARPDIQEKVHEELKTILGDSEREVTFQDTLEMKYLERCLLETLRLYPPVPFIARQLGKDLKLASRDATLPAGCTVVINTARLHRRPDLYPNPHHFDPDNFLPERTASRHFYSYIPFSAGPRSCVGRKYAMLKLKVLLASVLLKLKVVGGKPEKDWKLQGDVILKRADGFGVRLVPRHG